MRNTYELIYRWILARAVQILEAGLSLISTLKNNVRTCRIELVMLAVLPVVLAVLVSIAMGIKLSLLGLSLLLFQNIHFLKLNLNAYKGGQKLAPWPAIAASWPAIVGIIVLIGLCDPMACFDTAKWGLAVILLGWPSFWIIHYSFSWLTMSHNKRGFGPMTLSDIVAGISTFILFIVASLSLSLFIRVWRHLPLAEARKKATVHAIVHQLCLYILKFHFTTTQKNEGLEHLDFSQPRLLMVNHQSHIDLVVILKLHPKIIVLTNEWVWNNIFYGTIVRYLDYIPSHVGLEQQLTKVQEKVKQGYSVLVFPEGTRTPNGKIQRYRQGAFQLARALNLPIQPMLIHGARECLPKKEFYLHPSQLSLRVYPVDATKISADENNSCGPLAKYWTKIMRERETALKNELETDDYYSPILLRHYRYKGALLEWTLASMLEQAKHYQVHHENLPKKGELIEMGCGYGLLAYHLKLRAPERVYLGVDGDPSKISIAKGVFIADHPCEFSYAELQDWAPPPADAYIFNQVLEDLTFLRQRELLNHCAEHLKPHGTILVCGAHQDLQAWAQSRHINCEFRLDIPTGLAILKKCEPHQPSERQARDSARHLVNQDALEISHAAL